MCVGGEGVNTILGVGCTTKNKSVFEIKTISDKVSHSYHLRMIFRKELMFLGGDYELNTE